MFDIPFSTSNQKETVEHIVALKEQLKASSVLLCNAHVVVEAGWNREFDKLLQKAIPAEVFDYSMRQKRMPLRIRMISLTGTALPVARLRSWILRGGAAVSEQALFAVGNFVLNVALARSLPPAEYGAFAFTSTMLLILTGVLQRLHPRAGDRCWNRHGTSRTSDAIGARSAAARGVHDWPRELLAAAGLVAAGTTVVE